MDQHQKNEIKQAINSYFHCESQINRLRDELAPLLDRRCEISYSIAEKLNGETVIYEGRVWSPGGSTPLIISRYEVLD